MSFEGRPEERELSTPGAGLTPPLRHPVTVEEYRQILDDRTSPDAKIEKRLRYLEAFCRNVIRNELQKHATHSNNEIEK